MKLFWLQWLWFEFLNLTLFCIWSSHSTECLGKYKTTKYLNFTLTLLVQTATWDTKIYLMRESEM